MRSPLCSGPSSCFRSWHFVPVRACSEGLLGSTAWLGHTPQVWGAATPQPLTCFLYGEMMPMSLGEMRGTPFLAWLFSSFLR